LENNEETNSGNINGELMDPPNENEIEVDNSLLMNDDSMRENNDRSGEENDNGNVVESIESVEENNVENNGATTISLPEAVLCTICQEIIAGDHVMLNGSHDVGEKKYVCQHKYHELCILNYIRIAEEENKPFECPQCRKEFRSYLMCSSGETREIPRESVVTLDAVCMKCNSRFPQDNYVKMMEQLTNEYNELITDDDHVFQDRFGCKCVLCEYCVLTTKQRWMAEVDEKRTRTYRRCRRLRRQNNRH
jgi:hypothetical protein